MATQSSDQELVDRTLAGDSTAYAELVRRYRRAALACALAVVGDQQEADDVAQDAFIHGYDQLGTCRDPSRFGAWLLTIVRRRALNQLRSRKRRGTVPLEPTVAASGHGASASDAVETGELRGTLLSALAQLSPVQREVVLLADLEDWSHADISDKTGLSVTMSRRHLSDARRKLRGLLASLRPRAE